MTRTILFVLIAVLLSACTTPSVREDALPTQPTAVRTHPLPCHAPAHLVRDLTVPWSMRTYVIGSCPSTAAPAVSIVPAIPAASDIELSASERATP